jgi:hypothetical protein
MDSAKIWPAVEGAVIAGLSAVVAYVTGPAVGIDAGAWAPALAALVAGLSHFTSAHIKAANASTPPIT